MNSQTKVFRVHRALAWFYAVIGVGITVAVVPVSASAHRFEPAILAIPLMFGCIFAVHYLTARACKAGKEGGRMASTVLSCLMLLGFPIGTLIGIYLLSNTWRSWSAANDQQAR